MQALHQQRVQRRKSGSLVKAAALWAAIAFLVSLAAAIGFAAPAYAQTIEKAWTVEFTGTAMSDQGSTDIVKELNGMQPGDSAKFTVTMFENCDGAADWYMKNQVLESMEKSLRSGGSYSYKLTYTSPKGEDKVIITNEVVSGDSSSANSGAASTEGLFDATEATGEYFFLDTLAPEAKALMTLEVAIDGETHGNTYFDSDAKIQLSFAAEPTDKPGTPGDATQQEAEPSQPSQPQTTPAPEPQKSTNPLSQTGDAIALGLVMAVVAVSAIVLVVALVNKRRQKNKEDDAR